jgi:uncharacterized membrane protein
MGTMGVSQEQSRPAGQPQEYLFAELAPLTHAKRLKSEDTVGLLCDSVSKLWAKLGDQAAKIENYRQRILYLENQVAELRNARVREQGGNGGQTAS